MSKSNTTHAILIGIDFYFKSSMPDAGASYPSLGGCVRDINYVEDLLIKNIGILKSNILKLTASTNRSNNGVTSSSTSQEPQETKEKWPTYENMVSAFRETTDRAKSG